MAAVVAAVAIVLAGVLFAVMTEPRIRPSNGNNIPFPPPPDANLTDTDSDGLTDYNETHVYGTDPNNPDTDGDGMPDGWEVGHRVKDNRTGEWLLDPTDPSDAYEDPDNDGYDFDHNGYINGSEQDPAYKGGDRVYMNSQKVPADPGYKSYNISSLLSNVKQHQGKMVRVVGGRVVDNGSYNPDEGGMGRYFGRPILIIIADASTSQRLRVSMTAQSNRPINLFDDNSGPAFPADIVDVQGIFLGEGVDCRIECRGTERFTNIMEYVSTRDYDNNPNTDNSTDLFNWDTDGDGMSDGWEVQHGCGLINTSPWPPKWEWYVKLDPTSPDDAYGESNPAMTDLDGDRIQVPDTSTGGQKWVGYNKDEYLTILNPELERMVPKGERNLADILARKDIPRSWYAYGTDPTMADSDRDSFVISKNGSTPAGGANGNDFNEIFFTHTYPLSNDTDGDGMPDGWEIHYSLNATDPDDRLLDLDNDGLQNLQEFWNGTNPRRWDTDDEGAPRKNLDAIFDDLDDPACFDGMPDGWELRYGLDPLDPRDALKDNDVLNISGVTTARPDGLINLDEFRNGTDPRNPDTDGDGMTDGWEVRYRLNATDPQDGHMDPDSDGLVNLYEFQNGTNPRRWDSDDEGAACKDPKALFDDPGDPACFDGMPDGWELRYGLDPTNPTDAMKDSDVLRIGGKTVARPDGLLNLQEYRNGTDPTNPDTDGDRLSDYEEIVLGWDIMVNGKTEHFFSCATAMDSDDDTSLAPSLSNGSLPGPAGSEFLEPNETDTMHDLNDWNEITYHHTNATNPDTDGDGLSDGVELFTDRDPSMPGIQATNPCLLDTDEDGLNDTVEVGWLRICLHDGSPTPHVLRTSPVKADSDGDGLGDGFEVLHVFDISDPTGKAQQGIRLKFSADGYYYPAYFQNDTGQRLNSLNPADADTDHDGMQDYYEFNYSDMDCDGLPAYWEVRYGAGKLDPWKQDSDQKGVPDMAEDPDADGLDNLEEYRHRTDPMDPDSAIPGLEKPPGIYLPGSRADNGILDGGEGMLGADKSQPFRDMWGHPIPLRQAIFSDSDGDLMPDWWEVRNHLDLKANDSWGDLDHDGFANLDEYIYNSNPGVNDTDGDGVPDWNDHPLTFSPYCVDRDADGIGDWWEIFWFGSVEACDPNANPDGPWDPASGFYGDNWTNLQEWRSPPPGWPGFKFRCNPKINDSDGDGMNDDVDPYPVRIPFIPVPTNPVRPGEGINPAIKAPAKADMDDDGLPDLNESKYQNGSLDPADPDSDQDTMPDGWELEHKLDPLKASDAIPDPDNDGINYSLKWVDKNGNHWPDPGEWFITVYDFNGDGLIDPFFENESLCNAEEYWFGKDCDADGIKENTTDPSKSDTDGDGMMDGYEVTFADSDDDRMSNINELNWGLNPLDPTGINGAGADPDLDGYTNLQETQNNTSPWDPADHP